MSSNNEFTAKEPVPLSLDERRDRVYGALFGYLVGDALGLTTKYMQESEIKRKFGILDDIIGGGRYFQEAGDITDNTKLMFCVANGIVKKPKLPVTSIGEYLIDWFSKTPSDTSSSTRATICMAKGMSNTAEAWKKAAINTKMSLSSKTEGNNALARCLFASLFYDNLDDAVKIAVLQAKMTHFGNDTVDSVSIFTKIVWSFCNFNFQKDVIIKNSIRMSVIPAVPRPSSFVRDTFLSAVYCFNEAVSFENAVVLAANLGGESDTVSALCGALAGACYGYSHIPKRWIDKLSADIVKETEKLADYCLK